MEPLSDKRVFTAIEEVVAAVWINVLRLERVGHDDTFFEVGGHSLLAMQVISRLNETFQVDLPLRVMFEAPTVELLSKNLLLYESEPGKTEAIARRIQGTSDKTDASKDHAVNLARDSKTQPVNLISNSKGELPVSIQQEAGLLRSDWNQFLVLAAALSARSKLFYRIGSQVVRFGGRLNKSKGRAQSQGKTNQAVRPVINRNRVRIQKAIGLLTKLIIPDAEKLMGRKRPHIRFASRWKGTLNLAALEAALSEIIRRHEQLRMKFLIKEGRAVAQLEPAGPVSLPFVDLEQSTNHKKKLKRCG